jgi:hypothetical protein
LSPFGIIADLNFLKGSASFEMAQPDKPAPRTVTMASVLSKIFIYIIDF